MSDVAPGGAGARLDPDNPWPGLDAFEEDGRDFFHGRETEGEALVSRVVEAPVTVLFGKSGLGKTSLLKAGLFPRLRERRFLPVYVRLAVRPSAPPFADQVLAELSATFERDRVEAPPIREGASLWEYLHGADLELWDERNYPLTPVMVFDQFEELFTLGESVAEAVQHFRLAFGDLVENRIPAALAGSLEHDEDAARRLTLRSMPYKALLSLREDFLPDLEGWCRGIPSLGRVRFRLLAMGYRQAMAAVRDSAPHMMDEALARRIVRFVAAEQSGSPRPETQSEELGLDGAGTRGIEPALLSLFCRGLNEQRKKRGAARFDDELLDNAQQGIISDYYRSCIEGLPDAVSEFVESELITEKGFRNSYAREDAVPRHLTQAQLDHLIRRRLLRLEERHGTQVIELTHDLLTRTIREHRDWRRSERERALLAQKAEEERLALAEQARKREAQLEEAERIEREKRLQAEARAGRRFKRVAAALAVALLGAVALAVAVVQQTRAVVQQTRLAFERLEFAESARAESARQEVIAREQRERAERERDEATKQKRIADEKTMEAVRLREEAQKERDEATRQRIIAEEKTREAIRLREEEQKQRDEATRQKQIADEKTEESLQQRNTLGQLFDALRPCVVRVSGISTESPFQGSGFIVSAEGHVVTAAYVLTAGQNADDAAKQGIRVLTSDGATALARVVRLDRSRDLALLKAEIPRASHFLRFSDAKPGPGASVVALGWGGLARAWMPNSGAIVAVDVAQKRIAGSEASDSTDLIQVSIKGEPGFGGAPVVGLDQKVIGLWAYSDASGQRVLVIPAARIRAAFGSELPSPVP